LKLTFHSGSGGDDDVEGYVDVNYWSECSGKFTTLQQLEDAKKDLPAHCVEQYMLDVEISNYEGALKKYKDLVDNGYDKKFEVYKRFSQVS
jgi:hypothetical protein